MAGAGSEMSARNHRPLVSSSSTTSRMPPSVSENHIKKIAILKPQLAKKRPALSDITNQRDGFRAGSRVIGTQSKPIVVPCSAKIAKKKESSAHYHDKGLFGNTLPATLSAKADIIVKYAISPGIDLPTAIAIPAPSITIMVPRRTSISPKTSVGGSISLDEMMSTCDFLNSPEFEYIDREDSSEVKSIQRRSSSLSISDHEQGKTCKRDILLEIEVVDGFVDIDDNIKDPQFCATIACDIYKNFRATEAKKRPTRDFMERVSEEYSLVPETLFLAVNYIDHYLSGNVIIRQRLRLLGVACMMIAAK